MTNVQKNKFAAMLGNIIEWYDFGLYGLFAPVLSQAFFPSQTKYQALMYLFLTFASGYIVRPLGGVIFGYLGDAIGYGFALYYSIYLIMIPTIIVGIMPNYSFIGISAPILLILIRILQGLSVGGQYSGSLIFLHSQSKYKCAESVSIAYLGSIIGYILASCISIVSTYFFNPDNAWRIAFLFSLIFFPCVQYCKETLLETKARHRVKSKIKPLQIIVKYKNNLLKSMFLTSVGGIFYSCFFIFVVSYMNLYAGLNLSESLTINFCCLI